jgi:hypothetical protein
MRNLDSVTMTWSKGQNIFNVYKKHKTFQGFILSLLSTHTCLLVPNFEQTDEVGKLVNAS